jgi:glycosyltransferase involved in cell wall biosynthesis
MSIRPPICANKRVTAFAMGGQQRVTQEILDRLPDVETLTPERPLGGVKGHVWEQTVLPWQARGRVLWSPSATGPLLHARHVVTVYDTAFLDVPQFFAPSFVRLYSALVPLLARRAARVVTVSEFSRRQLAAAATLPEDRIDVIPNGVTQNFRPYPAEEIAATRAALGLPERYLLLQATADRRKNLAGGSRAGVWPRIGSIPRCTSWFAATSAAPMSSEPSTWRSKPRG